MRLKKEYIPLNRVECDDAKAEEQTEIVIREEQQVHTIQNNKVEVVETKQNKSLNKKMMRKKQLKVSS